VSARSLRTGTSAVGILLAAALLLGFNYLAARHWARSDWTRARIYSLSEQTKTILAGLKEPVRVTVFMTPRQSRLLPEVKELLTRYQALSPKIEVEYLDPERNPARAEALIKESAGVRLNTVVFRSGERKKFVPEDKLAEFDFAGAGMGGAPSLKAFKGEEAFTSAIVSVTETKQPKIVFTRGHNEGSLDSSERGGGYSEVKEMLERDNMTVATWDSLGKDDLPADADVVVVAGPQVAFLPPEAGALEKYLAGGGRALILLDPVLPGPGAPPPDLGFRGLVDKYGIRLGDDIVIDPTNALAQMGAEVVLADRYGSQPIVRSLAAEKLPVIFQLARSVTKAETPPEGVSESMLVETSPEGWGERDLNNLSSEVKKGPTDAAGPVSLAVAVGPADEAKPAAQSAARIVLVGNSRFAANGALANGANGIFFANAIHWLAGADKQIGIPPKTPDQTSLTLSESQLRRIAIGSIAGLPAFAILLGLWVWYRRRD
jgi:ABC-type uncharacterized transport system involved in gliding motility auxiliary subunit